MIATTFGSTSDIFGPVFDRLAIDLPRHFGVAAVRLSTVHAHERPFSHICRMRVAEGTTSRTLGHVYVKVFKNKLIDGDPDAMRRRVAHEFEATRCAQAALAPYPEFGVVPPVACYPEHLAIVTEQVDGPTLLAALEAHARWFTGGRHIEGLEEILHTVGRWIRVFQASGRTGATVGVDSIGDYIDIRLRRLVSHAAARFEARDRAAVLGYVTELGRELSGDQLAEVPIHADLSLGNVLVSSRKVVVLDFAMARVGTRLHDITRVYLQLDLIRTKPTLRSDVVQRLQRALLAGFDPALGPDDPLFRLMTMLHRVNNYGTLSIAPAPFRARLHNRVVRARHRRWIDRELAVVGARS